MPDDVLDILREIEIDIRRRIETTKRRIAALEADGAVMKAMLAFQQRRVGGPDFLPHLSVRRLFADNEIRGYCFEALAAANDCLDTRELTEIVMRRVGIDSEDVLVRKKIVPSVIQAMKTARRRGFVENEGMRKGVLLWRFVDGRAPDPRRLRW